MWHDGWGMGWGWGMGLWMVLFWGLLIAGLVILIRWAARGGSQTVGAQGEDPMAILRRRYARGEIDREEFEQKKRDLS